ncbi:cation:proton antiporter [Nocardia asiatica]|uniref:cation:proton antiporter domain-containing protein n=1 Tax=Nocardia asiatica TaxID=209252 RepID=UPI003EE3C6FC
MPRGELLDRIRARFEPLVGYLLLPAFFIYTGLNTELGLIFEPEVLTMTVVVLVVSCAGKFGAVGLVARSQGMGRRDGRAGQRARTDGAGPTERRALGRVDRPGVVHRAGHHDDGHHVRRDPVAAMFERSAWKNGMVFGPGGEEPKTATASQRPHQPPADPARL